MSNMVLWVLWLLVPERTTVPKGRYTYTYTVPKGRHTYTKRETKRDRITSAGLFVCVCRFAVCVCRFAVCVCRFAVVTPANRPAGRSLDPLLRMIDDLMENLRKAQDGTYLYLLGQLFFTTMSWLNHFKMDPHRALPAHRSPILSLNLFAGNELAAKLGVPLGSLASKLQQIYGVNMEQHGLNTDTDTIRQRYMDAASREQYRVFIRHGRAFFYNTHSHKLVARSTGQDGFGFALSMSNELYAA
jgi:hypothetical protein